MGPEFRFDERFDCFEDHLKSESDTFDFLFDLHISYSKILV